MAYFYDSKIIVSGRQAEIYKYKNAIWRDFSQKEKEEKEPKQLNLLKRLEKKRLQKQFSINRSRTEIRRLANANLGLNKFLTLTFAENISDLKTANYLFNKFILRMNYYYPDFRYLAVPEFQKRGAVHYHLLCNLPFVEVSEIEKMWRQGFVKINRIDKINNVGAYICKYLGKDMGEHVFGKKKFFRSRNLQEPTELIGIFAENFVTKFLSDKDPEFERIFYSKWTGEVDYKAYSLTTPPFPKGFDRNAVKNI
jgi:hypothetical protein